jgi:hypothetical protein
MNFMKDKFRELTAEELSMLKTLHARERRRARERLAYVDIAVKLAARWRVKFFYQGNFTIAILRDAQGETMRLGVAKRNSRLDPPRRIAGERQALRRAFLNPSLSADIGSDEVLALNLSEPKTASAGGAQQ